MSQFSECMKWTHASGKRHLWSVHSPLSPHCSLTSCHMQDREAPWGSLTVKWWEERIGESGMGGFRCWRRRAFRVKELWTPKGCASTPSPLPRHMDGAPVCWRTCSMGLCSYWGPRLIVRVVFFFFVCLGPHPRHIEVPRLGVKLEL